MADRDRTEYPFNELSVRDLRQTRKWNARLSSKLSDVELQIADGQVVLKEYNFILKFVDLACELGINLLCSDSPKICDLSVDNRNFLKNKLNELISIFKEVWLLRNREGGLADSLRWYDKVQNALMLSADNVN
jgi:hypothetical protein